MPVWLKAERLAAQSAASSSRPPTKCANAIAVWVRKPRGSSGSSRIALFKLSIAPSASPAYPRTQPLRSQAVARLTSMSSARLVSHKARSTSLKKNACTCPAQARATASSAPISAAASTSRAISFSSKFGFPVVDLGKEIAGRRQPIGCRVVAVLVDRGVEMLQRL